MRRVLKKYLIPHEGNNHTPHLLRGKATIALLGIIVVLFAFASLQPFLISYNNNKMAAVVDAVLVDLANKDRTANDLKPLTVNPTLQKAAELKVEDMATKGYFAHTSPEGITPWHWFSQAGYSFTYAGENLAMDFSESPDVETAWMNSPLHRENILNNKFTQIGIAVRTGVYEGRQTTYVVQLFGTPAVGAQAAYNPGSSNSKPSVSTNKQLATKQTAQASVKGAEVNTKVIAVNNNFVAVENASVAPVAAPTQNTVESPAPLKVSYSNIFERALSHPKNILVSAYALLACLIGFVIVYMFSKKFKAHHILNVAYGLILFAAMGSLSYAYFALFVSHVMVL